MMHWLQLGAMVWAMGTIGAYAPVYEHMEEMLSDGVPVVMVLLFTLVGAAIWPLALLKLLTSGVARAAAALVSIANLGH